MAESILIHLIDIYISLYGFTILPIENLIKLHIILHEDFGEDVIVFDPEFIALCQIYMKSFLFYLLTYYTQHLKIKILKNTLFSLNHFF